MSWIAVARGRVVRLAVTISSVLAVTLIPATAPSKPELKPHGCDTSRPGVTHNAKGAKLGPANVVPCLTYTFFGFGEANVVVTKNGAVMHGGAYVPEPQAVPFPGFEIGGNVARTVNKGRSWQFVEMPPPSNSPSRGAGDPLVWRDALTDRVWFTDIGWSPHFSCETEISYTDDGGKTWTHHPDPPFWGCPAFDFPQLFTGPPRGSTPTTRYPNVVYVCKSSRAVPPRQCWKSLDSARSFIEIPGVDSHDPRTAGIDGTIYGVSENRLHYSTNEGTTWTVGKADVPFEARPVVDRSGTVYLVGISNNTVRVTYSKNKGNSWSAPITVQMPGVKHAHEPTIAVPAIGKPGPVAVAYMGNGDTEDSQGDSPYHTGRLHHGYITTTDNIFKKNPVFRSVQVDSVKEPLLPYGYPAGRVPPGLGGTSTSPSRADYIGVYIADNGKIWAYFFKDLCPNPGMCECPKRGVCARPNPHPVWTNWLGAVATVHQR